MPLIAKKGGGDFTLPPAGTFQGVVFAVYDGGQQPDRFTPGETVWKIRIGIELDETYTAGEYAGERITRYPEYTLSLNDKSNLLPVVEAIMGRPLSVQEKEGFDLEKMIGKNCLVTIQHKVSEKSGKEYADTKIGAIMKNIPPMIPKLKPDYVPKFIQEWQSKGSSVGETIKPDNQITPGMYAESCALIDEFCKIDSVNAKSLIEDGVQEKYTPDQVGKLIVKFVSTKLSAEKNPGLADAVHKYTPGSKGFELINARQIMNVWRDLHPESGKEEDFFQGTDFNPTPVEFPGGSK